MSTFEIKGYKIASVEPHPNADRLDIVKLEGMEYILISQRGLRQVGDVVVYCPADSLIPEQILKDHGYWDDAKGKGLLSGSLGNRVKPKRLRGVFSEGIMLATIKKMGGYPLVGENAVCIYTDGTTDYSEILGITKYEPRMPAQMQGKAIGVFYDLTISYDFESIKKDPNIFFLKTVETEILPGDQYPTKKRTVHYDKPDEVWMSEKIHGSLIQFGICREDMANEKLFNSRVYFTSKGLGKQGVILDHNDEGNVWARALREYDLFNKLSVISNSDNVIRDMLKNFSLLFLGEVFGSGVQDLEYGNSGSKVQIRIFDAALVNSHQDYTMIDFNILKELTKKIGVELAPVLYVGPYSVEKLAELTDGLETVSGKATHIREGVVIKTTTSVWDEYQKRLVRKAAKSVSEAYHERKAAPGKELTEFQ